MKERIQIIREGQYLITKGLKNLCDYELRVLVQAREEGAYKRVISYLIDYLVSDSIEFKHEETIAFHSWLLKGFFKKPDLLELWEANSTGSGFSEGVDYAIQVVGEQEGECEGQKTSPVFPTFAQKIVISKGVYEGHEIEGVRYPSPEHMTGWWLLTDLFDDNIESLMTVHFYHVAFKRPDILKYLALPSGYVFDTSDAGNNIWFDYSVLED